MGHSERCPDLTTYWDRNKFKCAFCTVEPGHGITPNCGYDDNGGRHESPYTECEASVTFNDGSSPYCRPCARCAPGFNTSSPCNTTSDTQCQDPGSGPSGVPVAETTISPYVSSVFSTTTMIQIYQRSSINPDPARDVGVLWVIPCAILISLTLVVICAFLIAMKQRRGRPTVWSYRRRSSYINAGFSPLSAAPGNNDLEHTLSPSILSAPLQTVLDNLDVLEELVILLDPENQGVKNTKHLASHCSFPATWITYTYSMKDSKSPLKALLEGITSRYPDWTVGHLANLLKHVERNDAVAVLTKLRQNVMQV